MSVRTICVIILALVCGLSATVGVNVLVSKRVQSPTIETKPVVVTKAGVPRGKMLSLDMVEIKQWPKTMIPEGVMVNLADVKDRAALQTLMAGEPLFESKLAARGAVGGMANLIPEGKRAYTVQTKTVNSNVAGFLLPGNLVDVLLTFRDNNQTGPTGGGSTTTLLQSVEVLAVGAQVEQVDSNIGSNGPEDVKSVTLLVTPEETTRLDLGQSLGMLSLSLRNPNDKGEAETTPATIQSIRFGQLKPSAEDPASVAISVPLASEPDKVIVSPESPVTSIAPEKPPIASILTLRGQSWGQVHVQLPKGDKAAQP
jgi:pilus assembly protein CpaB